MELLNNTVSHYAGDKEEQGAANCGSNGKCRLLVTELHRGKQPEDFLLTREDGEPVRDFREGWETLTTKAEVPGLLFHDFRRSAVRNMIRRGAPQKTARTISGHKTDAVFSRYNIVSDADIRDAARRIEEGAKVAVSGSMHRSFIVGPERVGIG